MKAMKFLKSQADEETLEKLLTMSTALKNWEKSTLYAKRGFCWR